MTFVNKDITNDVQFGRTLDFLESERRKDSLSLKKFGIIVFAVYVITVVFFGFIGGPFNSFNVFVTFVLLMFSGFLPKLIASNYSNTFKRTVVTELLKFYGNFSYSKTGNTHADIVRNSKIIPNFDKIYGEDTISGVIDGVSFSVSEVVVNKSSGNNNQTVFQGLIYSLVFPTSFKCRILIKKDKGILLNMLNDKLNLSPLRLESTDFENKFECYTDDQVEARFVLSPMVIESIMNLDKYFFNKDISIEFFGKTVVCAVKTSGDYFDMGSPFISLRNMEVINKFRKQIEQILGFVDGLMQGVKLKG